MGTDSVECVHGCELAQPQAGDPVCVSLRHTAIRQQALLMKHFIRVMSTGIYPLAVMRDEAQTVQSGFRINLFHTCQWHVDSDIY